MFILYRMDMYAQDSIELLQKSGIQFKKHEDEGIDPHLFAELLTTSGVVFMENVTWLSFHAYVEEENNFNDDGLRSFLEDMILVIY